MSSWDGDGFYSQDPRTKIRDGAFYNNRLDMSPMYIHTYNPSCRDWGLRTDSATHSTSKLVHIIIMTKKTKTSSVPSDSLPSPTTCCREWRNDEREDSIRAKPGKAEGYYPLLPASDILIGGVPDSLCPQSHFSTPDTFCIYFSPFTIQQCSAYKELCYSNKLVT